MLDAPRLALALLLASASCSKKPVAPTAITVAGGDQQTAGAGSTVAIAPRVTVTNGAGPLRGVQVAFEVGAGGGSVQFASAVTDSSGHASCGAWVLGAAGVNQLTASVAGLPRVTFTAIAIDRSIEFSTAGGDRQSAAPAAALALQPTVYVADGATPLQGVEVTFTVTSGGGSVQFPSAVTDATGHATCGLWTLGPGTGVNVLVATIPAHDSVVFTAMADKTSSEITVAIEAPLAEAVVGEDVRVQAVVRSHFELSSVVATAGSASVALTPSSGTLHLAGQARGLLPIVVTATDVQGNTAQASVFVTLDRPPSLVVSSPPDQALARPQITLHASCTDDDAAGCASLTARVEETNTGIGSGISSLSEVVDLSAYEGQMVTVVITAVDSIGQTSVVRRTVFVESDPHLSLVADFGGPIWDVLGSRVLFVDPSGATPSLKIRDLSKSATETVETNDGLFGSWGDYGFLTSFGAVYARGDPTPVTSPYCWLYEWRGGALTNLTGLNSCDSLTVSGDFALYSAGDLSPFTLTERELDGGVSTSVTTTAGNIGNGVASDGTVAYWTSSNSPGGYNIHLWKAGVDTQITNDSASAKWNVYPLTDGTNTVYTKLTPCCVGQTYQIVLNDGVTETALTVAAKYQPAPLRDYQIASGRVAYTAPDNAGTLQVWLHSSKGETQLSFFGNSSTIDSLAPDGTVMFTTSSGRYLAAPDTALERIGSSLGQFLYRNGPYYVRIGTSLLQVVP